MDLYNRLWSNSKKLKSHLNKLLYHYHICQHFTSFHFFYFSAIRQKNQSLNYLRMSARVDAVASRVQTVILDISKKFNFVSVLNFEYYF